MTYHPGTHLIATLTTPHPEKLICYEAFQQLTEMLIIKYGLQKLGEVYHNFSPQGFTGVVCLSESHLSIHTWPECSKINIDIYLSNHLRTNDGTVQEMYAAIRQFFDASVAFEQTIKR